MQVALLMLEHLGEEKAATAIENAIMYVTANKIKDAGARQNGLFYNRSRRYGG